MKIGSGASQPARPRGEEIRREQSLRAGDERFDLADVVADHGGADAVALGIMAEALFVALALLIGPAEREIEVEAILRAQPLAGQRLCHRRDILVAERHRLQIGEAPPQFAQGRRQLQAAAIGGDAVLLPPDRLQRVAVAHPHLGLAGHFGEHLLVKADRFLIAADPAQSGRLEILLPGRALIVLGEQIELGDRLGGPVLLVEDGGEIGPRRREGGGELERAAQQFLGVGIAAEPPGQLGHHPDRGDVGRLFREARPQHPLRGGQIVVEQGLGGAHQHRVADRGGDARRARPARPPRHRRCAAGRRRAADRRRRCAATRRESRAPAAPPAAGPRASAAPPAAAPPLPSRSLPSALSLCAPGAAHKRIRNAGGPTPPAAARRSRRGGFARCRNSAARR